MIGDPAKYGFDLLVSTVELNIVAFLIVIKLNINGF